MRTIQPRQFNSTKNLWQFLSEPPFSGTILSVIKRRSVWWEKTKGVCGGKREDLVPAVTPRSSRTASVGLGLRAAPTSLSAVNAPVLPRRLGLNQSACAVQGETTTEGHREVDTETVAVCVFKNPFWLCFPPDPGGAGVRAPGAAAARR